MLRSSASNSNDHRLAAVASGDLSLASLVAAGAAKQAAIPDAVWDQAARHYNEVQLAALVLAIASINAWNRVNAATRQITGEWVNQLVS